MAVSNGGNHRWSINKQRRLPRHLLNILTVTTLIALRGAIATDIEVSPVEDIPSIPDDDNLVDVPVALLQYQQPVSPSEPLLDYPIPHSMLSVASVAALAAIPIPRPSPQQPKSPPPSPSPSKHPQPPNPRSPGPQPPTSRSPGPQPPRPGPSKPYPHSPPVPSPLRVPLSPPLPKPSPSFNNSSSAKLPTLSPPSPSPINRRSPPPSPLPPPMPPPASTRPPNPRPSPPPPRNMIPSSPLAPPEPCTACISVILEKTFSPRFDISFNWMICESLAARVTYVMQEMADAVSVVPRLGDPTALTCSDALFRVCFTFESAEEGGKLQPLLGYLDIEVLQNDVLYAFGEDGCYGSLAGYSIWMFVGGDDAENPRPATGCLQYETGVMCAAEPNTSPGPQPPTPRSPGPRPPTSRSPGPQPPTSRSPGPQPPTSRSPGPQPPTPRSPGPQPPTSRSPGPQPPTSRSPGPQPPTPRSPGPQPPTSRSPGPQPPTSRSPGPQPPTPRSPGPQPPTSRSPGPQPPTSRSPGPQPPRPGPSKPYPPSPPVPSPLRVPLPPPLPKPSPSFNNSSSAKLPTPSPPSPSPINRRSPPPSPLPPPMPPPPSTRPPNPRPSPPTPRNMIPSSPLAPRAPCTACISVILEKTFSARHYISFSWMICESLAKDVAYVMQAMADAVSVVPRLGDPTALTCSDALFRICFTFESAEEGGKLQPLLVDIIAIFQDDVLKAFGEYGCDGPLASYSIWMSVGGDDAEDPRSATGCLQYEALVTC
ncbi:hypothetical protein Vretimale_10614 [Volvox reticuliferus]|uniref:Pherophorin domain-containing protein n=1 Tax=Volvox reticuliferus TaxID=1737510 RepID=A0A8J4LRG5_9CHLO|nr:hypothetical protein Vretimale_10614 [Volvox reticuliferus]